MLGYEPSQVAKLIIPAQSYDWKLAMCVAHLLIVDHCLSANLLAMTGAYAHV